MDWYGVVTLARLAILQALEQQADHGGLADSATAYDG